MNKTFIVAAVIATSVGAGMFATQTAFAQSAATVTNTSPMSSLVQRISEKFGLQQADVQAVFDQDKQERQAKREADYTARLDQLVKDGKITEAQKQLIVEKHAELKAKRQTAMQNFKDKTAEERKAAMDVERTSLEEWAKQNNIDMQYLMPHGPGMGRGGHKGFGKMQ